ncbi:MAG: AmmeMemoRadiSam system protein B [Bryobacteraceae bacterium]|nr:AmmeMemoRadiSam system protein B [Bryobacteraceae bacterium]
MMAIHASPYAGSWYPGDRAELEPMLERIFEASAKRTGTEMWPGAIAFVVPHAGLMYSGGVAAAAYRHIQAERPSRVFILGFCHRGGRGAVELPDIEAFETPMGGVRVDVDAVRSLAGKAPFAMAEECDVCDHSVEIQLPLLQYAAPDAVVVPLYVGHLDEVKRRAAAEVLASEFLQGDVLLASTDLTHFGRDFGYLPFPADENAQDRISDLDHDAIEAAGSLEAGLFLETLRQSKATVCGYEPVALLLETLTALGGGSIFQKELDYRTSADISGDTRHSVSYAALAYFREQSLQADAETQAALLESVRETLRRLRGDGPGGPAMAAGDSAALKRKPAVFVSLHHGRELFGCIGTRAKELTLAEAIPYLTHASADDPRFPRGRGIPEDLDIEVSILTPMKRVRDWTSFRLGVDGAYLIVGGRCGLLLPQVAGHGIDTPERFLECLSRKIGLPANAYRDREAKLFVFHAQVFGGRA